MRGPVHLGDYCLATFIGTAIAESCASDNDAQTWTFQDGQLQQPDGCLTLGGQRATLATCTGANNQRWHRTEAGQLQNLDTNTCLIAANSDQKSVPVSVTTCDN